MTRKIEYLPLSELKSDPRNPKAHDTATISQSVDRFGYVEPVAVDGRTGYIISGHGRVKVLTESQKAGDHPPDGVRAKDDEWLIPVVTGWSSTSDSEAAAALIALNQTTVLGGWVDDALLTMLDELALLENGLTGVGYNAQDIDDLRARLDELDSFQPLDTDDDTDRLDNIDARPCPKCGYDLANDPEDLRKR